MKKIFLISFVFLLFFNGNNVFKVDGYRPVYVPKEEAKVIKVLPPRDVITQGKIYVKDNYIFVDDVNQGIHVIDNSDPRHPQKIAFIQIYGNHDIAVKGNTLYADNMDDLVAIDISDMQSPTLVKRVEGVYKMPNQHFPEDLPFQTYFECPDPSKGLIVGWIPAELENPKCYTSY
jgi:hypothetical protein